MNSYISNPNTTHVPRGGSYVSTAHGAANPSGYVSKVEPRGAGTYVKTQWVRAA